MTQFWVIMSLRRPLWEQVAGVECRSRPLGLGKLGLLFFSVVVKSKHIFVLSFFLNFN